MKERPSALRGLFDPSWFLLAAAGCGLGIWLAGLDDQLHIFRDQRGTEQVLLTTLAAERLVPMLILGLLLVFSAWFLFRRLQPGVGVGEQTDRRAIAAALLPLTLLGLAGLRYLPSVGDFSPSLLLLASTMAPAWAALIFLTCAFSLSRLFFRGDGRILVAIRNLDARRTAWLIFATVAIVIGATLPSFLERTAFAGDQPHYLLVTHSILEDGDIYFEDDYRDGVWKEFAVVSRLDPQARIPTLSGRLAPFHRFGVAALAVPFYAVGGKTGAVLLIVLIAALGAASLYSLLRKTGISQVTALAVTGWATFSLPLLAQSLRFMMDLPLGVFTLVSFNLAFAAGERRARPRAALLIAWFLPWIHARGLVIGAVLTLFILWEQRKQPRRVVLLLLAVVPLAASISLLNGYLYGDFSPLAEMGARQKSDLQIVNVVTHSLATLFDGGFGVFIANPVVLIALFGFIPLGRRNLTLAGWIILLAGAGFGPAMAFNHWWGGNGMPNRYVSTLVPWLALALAALMEDTGWQRLRRATPFLMIAGIGIAFFVVTNQAFLVNDRAAYPQVLSAVSAGPLMAQSWWPYWFSTATSFWVHLLYLLAAIGVIGLLLFFLAKGWRRLPLPEWARTGMTPTLLLASFVPLFMLYTAGAERFFPLDETLLRPGTPRAASAYINRVREGGYRMVDFTREGSADALPAQGFSARRLGERQHLRADDRSPLAFLPLTPGEHQFELPAVAPTWAGHYNLDFQVAAEEGEAEVEVTVRNPWQARAGAPALAVVHTRIGRDPAPLRLPVSLAQNAASLRISLRADVPIRLYGGTMQPLQLTTRAASGLPSDLFDVPAITGEGWVLFQRAGSLYPPEGAGFWTPGDYRGDWRIQAAGAARAVEIRMQAPTGVKVELNCGELRQVWTASRRERETTLRLPIAVSGSGSAPPLEMSLTVTGGFVPAETVAGSQDTRRLGARIAIRTVY